MTVGCQEDPGIRSYDAPKTAERAPASAPMAGQAAPQVEPAAQADPARMLAAIVPVGDKLWFFKLVGPIDQVNPLESDIDSLLASIKLAADADNQLVWETPAGWKELPASGMREATLVAPDAAGGLELSVSILGASGDLDADILNNVNRWRGQMGLPPTKPEALADSTDPLEAIPGAVVVDVEGEFAAAGMAPPMATRPAPVEPPPPAAEPRFSSELPEGWTKQPDRAMRIATYQAGEAEVVVSQFAAFGAMGDALENVNRWRMQVGLEPAAEEDLDKLSHDIEIAGKPGRYFQIVAPDQPTGMLAAMSVRGDQVWFFKLTGPREAVATQRDAFGEWLDTIKITD